MHAYEAELFVIAILVRVHGFPLDWHSVKEHIWWRLSYITIQYWTFGLAGCFFSLEISPRRSYKHTVASPYSWVDWTIGQSAIRKTLLKDLCCLVSTLSSIVLEFFTSNCAFQSLLNVSVCKLRAVGQTRLQISITSQSVSVIWLTQRRWTCGCYFSALFR